MAEFPETQSSLVARLKNASDDVAWGEFFELYRPAVYRLARQRGLQPEDAEDLAQRVFVSVAKAVQDWNPDPALGTFRAWLKTIARNAIINALGRSPPDAARGGSSILERLHERPLDDDQLAEQLEDEYRRAVFRRAATKVAGEVQPDTWQAFWLTAVDCKSAEEAAGILGKDIGSIYAARSRIMRRLREYVQEYEREQP
jgi:RNA polymerase sigma-70 factor, ECF subfamily